jgi:hypothetical protein
VAEPVEAPAAVDLTRSATEKAKVTRDNREKTHVFHEKTRIFHEKTRDNCSKTRVNHGKARTITVAEPVEAPAAMTSTSSATAKAKFTRDNHELSRGNY